jgi:hypothetical protein
VQLRFIGNSPRQVGFGTIPLIVHSKAIGSPLRESQVVETLAAFLIVLVAQLLRLTFREIEPMPLPIGEHKHNTLSEATTVVEV